MTDEMKTARSDTSDSSARPKNVDAGQVRLALVALICFLLGLALGAVAYHRAATAKRADAAGAGSSLATGTHSVLAALTAPVHIRFYALLDPATTSDSLRDFARRADQLLAEYERAAGDKIKLTRQTAPSAAAAQAAAADGIKPFNLQQGDACFLGLALVCRGQKETLGQLAPEWEVALEADLSRAIARVAVAKPSPQSAIASTAKAGASTIEEVKRAIPNLNSVSLAEATQTLRVAALKEFAEATEAMERAVKDAEQRVQQAQSGGSEADQQTAVKHLQQVQAEHTEKLKQIAAALQARIAALSQLKRK